MRTSPRYICFDLDGTLVHAAHLEAAFTSIASEAGAKDEQIRALLANSFAHQPFTASLAHLLPGHTPAETELLHQRFWARVSLTPGELLPGAREALAWAEAHADALFISTGTPPALLEATLRAYGWERLFTLACGSSPGFDKADAHLPACAEALGLQLAEFAAESMIVGDGHTEITQGTRLGMPWRVGIAQDPLRAARLHQLGATHLISSVGGLPELHRSGWRAGRAAR